MQNDHLRIVQGYTKNNLNKFETRLMDLFFEAPTLHLGKLSTIYPEHYKAYIIIQLERPINKTVD